MQTQNEFLLAFWLMRKTVPTLPNSSLRGKGDVAYGWDGRYISSLHNEPTNSYHLSKLVQPPKLAWSVSQCLYGFSHLGLTYYVLAVNRFLFIPITDWLSGEGLDRCATINRIMMTHDILYRHKSFSRVPPSVVDVKILHNRCYTTHKHSHTCPPNPHACMLSFTPTLKLPLHTVHTH